MKNAIIAVTAILFVTTVVVAQNNGYIKSAAIKPRAGISNLYIYQPPKNLLIPPKMQALVLYQLKQAFYKKALPVKQVGDQYQFYFKAPDSVAVLMIGMVDGDKEEDDQNGLVIPRKEVVDNNSEAGYIVFLQNASGHRFAFEYVSLSGLLKGYAPYNLGIKVSDTHILQLYKTAYQLNPQLKKEDHYIDYLALLYQQKKDTVKSQLLAHANKLLLNKHEEKSWLNAVRIYNILKMEEEAMALKSNVLITFPNGEFAMQKYWEVFRESSNKTDETEASVLSAMHQYINRFNDTTGASKDLFYDKIITMSFNKRDLDIYAKYESLYHNADRLMSNNNWYAWRLSGRKLDNAGRELETAKLLSGKALRYIEGQLNSATLNDENYEALRSDYFKFTNTYALILYKLKQYDTAFYYQDIVYHADTRLNAGAILRYSAYAEKVKGATYAKAILEEHLQKGLDSPEMLQQLQAIYKQLNLPENTFIQLKKKNNLLAREKNNQAIKAKYGTTKAIDFSLKNLEGREVSLSSCLNKVVVLDFWATWCGPCRASFPAMQSLASQYKEDTSVVFLFIDVWENSSPQKMKAAALKLMQESNYHFNVLLDTNDKVATDYKVEGIPAKFVIDTKGHIVYMGKEVNDFSLIIEGAKE